LIFEPASVVRPAMSNRFFTAYGTPSSGSSRVRAPRRGQRGIDLRRAAQRALGQHGR
jgi:hypothetical protein